MLVFPAIDLLGGKAVRLGQGRRDTATVYSDEPWKLAQGFAAAGAPAPARGRSRCGVFRRPEHNQATIARIIGATTMDVEVGGGLRTAEDCERLFAVGRPLRGAGNARRSRRPAVVEELCQKFPAEDRRGGRRPRGQGRGGRLARRLDRLGAGRGRGGGARRRGRRAVHRHRARRHAHWARPGEPPHAWHARSRPAP